MFRRNLMRLGMLLAAFTALLLVPGQAGASTGDVTVEPIEVAAAPILNPHPTCPGSLAGAYDWKSGNTLLGTLYVYYSSANGGTNCLWLQKSYHRGTPSYMYVDVAVCSGSTCTVKDIDEGPDFKSYAGEVIATGTAGKCIDSIGVIEGFAKHFGPFHCG